MNKRTLFLLALLALTIGALVGYRLFNAKVPVASDRTAEAEVTAEGLFQAFQADEAAAGQLYNDKVIAVSGPVREVITEADGRTTVVLDTGDPLGGVACELAPGADHALVVGAPVTIKGFCAGFNLDVLLQRCVTTN